MNKILNGSFSSGFDYWTNPASGLAFSLYGETAQGLSRPLSEASNTYKMNQEFSSNDEIITATITVWASWTGYSGSVSNGSNRFVVELEKPDITKATLVDTSKGDEVGNGQILDAVDIAAHMTQYGNYKLWLTLVTVSAKSAEPDPPPDYYYTISNGLYDGISIDVTVKKYKTVHEMIGSSGALGGKASVSRSEAVGLVEAYSTETFSPTHNYETASESVGLSESYSKILKRIHGEVEVVGLSETIQAKRIQGNLETTYVLEDLTQWTEISKVETPWIKIKTELA